MIDLHTHSLCSDGTVSPGELVRLAERTGLSAVALCDHNTLAGLPEFVQAGKTSPVETVCGIEISTDYGDTELHILGLFVRPEHWDTINHWLQDALARKDASNRELVQALNRAGIVMDYDCLKASAKNGFVNRPVIGAELTRLGVTVSVKDAFDRYLHPRHGFYVPPKRPDSLETIRFLKNLGIVSVLAHPMLNLDTDSLRQFLSCAVKDGLVGMETMYPKYTAEQTAISRQLAAHFGLAESGGSDFHGKNKPETLLGSGISGNLSVPETVLAILRSKLQIS